MDGDNYYVTNAGRTDELDGYGPHKLSIINDEGLSLEEAEDEALAEFVRTYIEYGYAHIPRDMEDITYIQAGDKCKHNPRHVSTIAIDDKTILLQKYDSKKPVYKFSGTTINKILYDNKLIDNTKRQNRIPTYEPVKIARYGTCGGACDSHDIIILKKLK